MSYEITVKGFAVRCATAEELVELLAKLSHEQNGAYVNSNEQRGDSAPGSFEIRHEWVPVVPVDESLVRAVNMLRAIEDAGQDGILTGELQARLGIAHPKGLGSVTAGLVKRLRFAGINPNIVFITRRTPEGRTWTRRSGIVHAIEILGGRLDRGPGTAPGRLPM